ncbi:MAG: FAD:protein FMN transferase [Christensenellaceae bacterium]|nr:FAD:protein FMN transferase [Christensenellaceae bacterium]
MKKRLTALLLAALLLLCGCGAKAQNTTCFAMGTVCCQTVYGPKELADEGEKLLFAADSDWSWRKAESQVSRINALAGSFVPVDEQTFMLIALAKEVAEASGGTFDPTLGSVTCLWDFAGENPSVPAAEDIQKGLAHVDWRGIELDEETKSVRIRKGQRLDLGGIAKGAAADKLAGFYTQNGVKSALLNLGGNVYALGTKPDGSAYVVGVRDPASENGYLCTLEVADKAVVVSGAYERFFEADGKVYHHILDSTTGYPVESELTSACIVAAQSALADALSTAVYVLGAEKGLALAEAYGADALLLTKDGRLIMSEGFEENYHVQWTQGLEYRPD